MEKTRTAGDIAREVDKLISLVLDEEQPRETIGAFLARIPLTMEHTAGKLFTRQQPVSGMQRMHHWVQCQRHVYRLTFKGREYTHAVTEPAVVPPYTLEVLLIRLSIAVHSLLGTIGPNDFEVCMHLRATENLPRLTFTDFVELLRIRNDLFLLLGPTVFAEFMHGALPE